MNSISKAALVVGTGGNIGSALINFILPRYKVVYATTRRSTHRNFFFKFDLSDDFDQITKIASLCDIAFICAGTTGLVECENDAA